MDCWVVCMSVGPMTAANRQAGGRAHSTVLTARTHDNMADTAVDYANIFEHLVDLWDIEHIGGLSGEAVRVRLRACCRTRDGADA